VNVQITWRGPPFTGASGQRKADKFETEGVNIQARKPERGNPKFFAEKVAAADKIVSP
jgi:hypothetical protein